MLCLLYLRLFKVKRKLSRDLPFKGQVFSARLVDKRPGNGATFCFQALQREQLFFSSFHNTVGGCWVCAVINRGIGSSSRLHVVCVSHWLGGDLEAGCWVSMVLYVCMQKGGTCEFGTVATQVNIHSTTFLCISSW